MAVPCPSGIVGEHFVHRPVQDAEVQLQLAVSLLIRLLFGALEGRWVYLPILLQTRLLSRAVVSASRNHHHGGF